STGICTVSFDALSHALRKNETHEKMITTDASHRSATRLATAISVIKYQEKPSLLIKNANSASTNAQPASTLSTRPSRLTPTHTTASAKPAYSISCTRPGPPAATSPIEVSCVVSSCGPYQNGA